MKKAAIVLMALALICGGVLGYGLFHTSLQVTGKALQTLPATDRGAEFEALRTAVEGQSLIGTMLKNTALTRAEDYSYYIYTLRLRNPGLVAAEMVELQITPMAADVLFYGENQEIVIPPGETKDVWCVLLTQGAPHAVRDIHVTYYLWGHPHEVKFTYDPSL